MTSLRAKNGIRDRRSSGMGNATNDCATISAQTISGVPRRDSEEGDG